MTSESRANLLQLAALHQLNSSHPSDPARKGHQGVFSSVGGGEQHSQNQLQQYGSSSPRHLPQHHQHVQKPNLEHQSYACLDSSTSSLASSFLPSRIPRPRVKSKLSSNSRRSLSPSPCKEKETGRSVETKDGERLPPSQQPHPMNMDPSLLSLSTTVRSAVCCDTRERERERDTPKPRLTGASSFATEASDPGCDLLSRSGPMPDLSSSFSSSYPVAVSGASHTHAHTRQQQTHHQGLQRERSFEALPGWKGKGGRGRPLESVAEHSASFSITQTSSHSHTTSDHQQKELSTLPLRQHVHGQQQSAPHLFNCECAHRDTATEKEKGDGGIGSYRESDSVVRRAAACPVCCQQAAVSCRSLREKGVLLKGAAVSVSASVSGGGGGGRRGSVSTHTNGGGGSVPCSSQMSNASSSTIAPSHSGGSLPQTGGTSREEDPLPLPPPQTQAVNGRSLRVLKDEREGRRLQRRERSVGGEHGGEVQHVDGSSSGWKPADQRSAVSLLSSVDGSVRASGGEVGGNGSGTRKEACGCGKRRPGRREAACFQEVAVSGSFADSLSPPPPIVRGSGTGASQVPQMAAPHAAVGGIEPPHPPCQEKRENEGKDPLAGEGGGTGETKKEKVWKTIVKWSCDHCKTECIPVREESRCLCGHRLKDHEWVPEKERSRERERGRQAGRSRKSENSESERGGSAGGGGAGRLVCKRNGCECGSFFYVVAEGAWVLRCSCKHKHTDHSPNSHRCRRNNCKCERFFSPWTCNCDHPWASHRQTTERVEARSHLPLDVLMEMLKADTSSHSQRDLVSLQQKQQRGGNLDEEAEAQQAAAGRGARQRRRQHSGSESGWAEHEALTASSSSHTIPPQQPRRERERERGEHCAPFSSERTVEPPPPPGRVWHGGSREDMGGRGGREEVGVSGGDKGKVSSRQQGGGGVPVALALPSRPNNSNNMAVAVAAAAAAKAAMEEFGLVTGEINDYSRLLRGGAFNDRPLPVQRGGASGW